MVLITLLLPIKVFIFTICLRITPATILKCFKHYPNYYLGKSGNLVVVNISSINSCLDHCLKSQLLYEFICRSVMINRVQRECILSKWSPDLTTYSRYRSKVVYTDFYQNICLPPWNQIQHFTVAPPRTTFPIPISNTRLLIPNSINRVIKNYKSVSNMPDIITVNIENKKKPSFETVLHSAQHVPSSNSASRTIQRSIKSTQTTAPPVQKSTAYYFDYYEDRSNNNDSNKDCDNNNKHYDDVNDDNGNDDSDDGSDDDDDGDDDDYDDDDDDDNNNNDDIYNNNAYKDSDTSDLLSSNDEQSTSANNDIPYRVAGSLRTSARTIKNVAIRPGPVITHHSFQHSEASLAKITPTVSFFSTTIITPSISNTVTASDNITTITTTATTIATVTSTFTTTITSTTTTTTTTTNTAAVTTTTITKAITTTATTATVISSSQFIPVPINMLVPKWNTTTKDSELSIQHQNYTLNIGIIEQNPNNRRIIRNGLIEELKCFHYFANNQLNGYEEETIKQIGLQDCLHNCILRIAFLCLSINYNNQTKECILNGGSRIINNDRLIPSTSTDYYEYVCLSARKQESKARTENPGNYNITKLRKCFSICENAVMYTLNGLVVDNIYTPLECLMTCAISHYVYKAKCYSVNWFKNTRTCYLHTAKTDINDLKVTTSSDFFLNNCADSNIPLKTSNECEEGDCVD